MTQQLESRPAIPVMEFGTAKPSDAILIGRTVEALQTSQLVRMRLVKSVDYEHGDGMDQFAPALATCPVAQVGRTIVHQYSRRKRLNILRIIVYVYCACISDLFFLLRLEINHMMGNEKYSFILEPGAVTNSHHRVYSSEINRCRR